MSNPRHHGSSLTVDLADFPDPADDTPVGGPPTAVLAGGCFWCVEAVYRQLDGVLDVEPGYCGGTADTANYTRVCSGTTDHAEAVRITFDPRRVSYGRLLKVFFSVAHDPTQRNRQGPDVGRQYRSVIFSADPEQARIAKAYIRQLNEAGVFTAPIVTEVAPLEKFHVAEKYHHEYLKANPDQPYVRFHALPKVEQVRAHYGKR